MSFDWDRLASEAKSTILGLILIAGSGLLTYEELWPWYATVFFVIVGLYLCLPHRVRNFGDWAKSMVKVVRELRQ